MFGKKQETAAVTEQAIVTIPKPLLNLGPLPPDNYSSLCESIGANQLSSWNKLCTIVGLEIGNVYELDEVNKFLDKLTPKYQAAHWKPLCGKITKEGRQWRYGWDTEKDRWQDVWLVSRPAYSKPVPKQALSLISMIEKEAPDTFGYYVSDYASVPRPDPFLMVRNENTDTQLIVMHWDEPMWDAAKRLRED